MNRVRSRLRRLLQVQCLEPRHLLSADAGSGDTSVGTGLGGSALQGVGEGLLGPTVEFKLEVTQNGQSILDGNRNFNVTVGERFDLELLYSDLRSPLDRVGLSGFAAKILSSMPSTFRPVVRERQLFSLSDELLGVTGGSLVVGLEGSSNTSAIEFAALMVNPTQAFASAAEAVMGSASGSVKTEFFENPFLVSFDFLDEGLALADIPNLTIDTSGLTGASVTSSFTEVPAFIDGDPSKGVNPATFRTAIDFHSRSLNDLQFYSAVAGGGFYVPDNVEVFRDLFGFGSFSSNVAMFAADNSIAFDGTDFEALSIRIEAIQEASSVDFTVAPVDDFESFVYVYDTFDQLPLDHLVFDLDDDPSIPGDDRFALVTGNFGAVALPPFQNPINRFDVNNDGEVRAIDGIILVLELNNREISAPDGTLPDPPPDPIINFIDVNGDNLFTQDDLDDVLEALGQIDFGDAPSAAQSGFASSYPTLLVDDGARHISTGLHLGADSSQETDGTPHPDADADSADDGIEFLTPISTSSSTAVVEITASDAGKVDAWIDFNRDGDWLDAGEQIFDDLTVAAGTSAHSFAIPGAIMVGTTFARFRLSTAGVSGPTGRASDGEVEDYLIVITEESGDPRNPVVNINGSVTITNVEGSVVITDGGGEIFNRPLDQLDTLTVLGSADSDAITYDQSGGSFVPTLGLKIDGDDGFNTLVVVGGAHIDATPAGLVTLLNLQVLDLRSPDESSIKLDSDVTNALANSLEPIQFLGNTEDRLFFADAADWRMGDPIVDGSLFLPTVIHLVSGIQIIAEVPNSFTNVIDPSDINNDGEVSSRDALAVINELARRAYSVPVVGTVFDPSGLDPWPGNYGDQNRDDRVTALDALRVINELARRALQEGEFYPIANEFDDDAQAFEGELSLAFESLLTEQVAPKQTADYAAWVFCSAESQPVIKHDALTNEDSLDVGHVDEVLSAELWESLS